MVKAFGIVFLLALAGCSGVPLRHSTALPCSMGESTYECQVERYHNVNVQ